MAGERDFVNDEAVLSKMLELKPEYSLWLLSDFRVMGWVT